MPLKPKPDLDGCGFILFLSGFLITDILTRTAPQNPNPISVPFYARRRRPYPAAVFSSARHYLCAS